MRNPSTPDVCHRTLIDANRTHPYYFFRGQPRRIRLRNGWLGWRGSDSRHSMPWTCSSAMKRAFSARSLASSCFSVVIEPVCHKERVHVVSDAVSEDMTDMPCLLQHLLVRLHRRLQFRRYGCQRQISGWHFRQIIVGAVMRLTSLPVSLGVFRAPQHAFPSRASGCSEVSTEVPEVSRSLRFPRDSTSVALLSARSETPSRRS